MQLKITYESEHGRKKEILVEILINPKTNEPIYTIIGLFTIPYNFDSIPRKISLLEVINGNEEWVSYVAADYNVKGLKIELGGDLSVFVARKGSDSA